MLVTDRARRRAERLVGLVDLWNLVHVQLTFRERYAAGCSRTDAGEKTDALDPAATKRSLLLWLRLVARDDDELYVLALADLLDHLDLVHYTQVEPWEAAHPVDLVLGAVTALRTEAHRDLMGQLDALPRSEAD